MALERMFFPGGNTCDGFHSFYEYVVPPDATRLFILKGGPGVGKSTIMKKLAREPGLFEYDQELHWCSSDQGSLDALVLPDCQIAIMDGTAPHLVDPRYPGAVDEIVNLGDYWEESELVKQKMKIIDLTQLKALYFRIAYLRLKEARAVWNELTEYYRDSVPRSLCPGILRKLRREIVSAGTLPDRHNFYERHLFASAITPSGVITHAGTLIEQEYRVVALAGSPGTGVHDLLASILRWTQEEMLPVEVYHNCFMPSLLEMIIIRTAKIVILDASGMVTNYEPLLGGVANGRFFDLDPEVDPQRTLRFGGEIDDCQERFQVALRAAVGFINLAKQVHDELEMLYVPAMDFKRMNGTYSFIRDRILNYLAHRRLNTLSGQQLGN